MKLDMNSIDENGKYLEGTGDIGSAIGIDYSDKNGDYNRHAYTLGVTFGIDPYQGRSDRVSVPDKIKVVFTKHLADGEYHFVTEDDIEKTTEEAVMPEEEPQSSVDVGLIIGLTLSVAVIIFMIYIAKHPMKHTITGNKKKNLTENIKKQEKDKMSDEEEYIQMKAQLTAEYDNYNKMIGKVPETDESEVESAQEPDDDDPFMTGGQDDDEVTNSIEEYDASFTDTQSDDWIDDQFS